MNQLDNEFFEEFKRLDKLCKDIYGRSADNKLSVSLYINDMEQNFQIGSCIIPSWAEDLRLLKKCRHIRNELAHGDFYPPNGLCTQEHLYFIASFRDSILNGTDPLALLDKHLHAKIPSISQSSYANMNAFEEFGNYSGKNSYNFTAIILIACIGIVLLLTFGIFAIMLSHNGFHL